jgi:hypothetical protein
VICSFSLASWNSHPQDALAHCPDLLSLSVEESVTTAVLLTTFENQE